MTMERVAEVKIPVPALLQCFRGLSTTTRQVQEYLVKLRQKSRGHGCLVSLLVFAPKPKEIPPVWPNGWS